eukprot:g13764.t1
MSPVDSFAAELSASGVLTQKDVEEVVLLEDDLVDSAAADADVVEETDYAPLVPETKSQLKRDMRKIWGVPDTPEKPYGEDEADVEGRAGIDLDALIRSQSHDTAARTGSGSGTGASGRPSKNPFEQFDDDEEDDDILGHRPQAAPVIVNNKDGSGRKDDPLLESQDECGTAADDPLLKSTLSAANSVGTATNVGRLDCSHTLAHQQQHPPASYRSTRTHLHHEDDDTAADNHFLRQELRRLQSVLESEREGHARTRQQLHQWADCAESVKPLLEKLCKLAAGGVGLATSGTSTNVSPFDGPNSSSSPMDRVGVNGTTTCTTSNSVSGGTRCFAGEAALRAIQTRTAPMSPLQLLSTTESVAQALCLWQEQHQDVVGKLQDDVKGLKVSKKEVMSKAVLSIERKSRRIAELTASLERAKTELEKAKKWKDELEQSGSAGKAPAQPVVAGHLQGQRATPGTPGLVMGESTRLTALQRQVASLENKVQLQTLSQVVHAQNQTRSRSTPRTFHRRVPISREQNMRKPLYQVDTGAFYHERPRPDRSERFDNNSIYRGY